VGTIWPTPELKSGTTSRRVDRIPAKSWSTNTPTSERLVLGLADPRRREGGRADVDFAEVDRDAYEGRDRGRAAADEGTAVFLAREARLQMPVLAEQHPALEW
jgi:hypothetical protein